MCHCDRATFRATKASCQHSGLISWLKVIAAFALTRFCWRMLQNFPGTNHLDFNTGDAKAPIKNYILTEERGTYFFPTCLVCLQVPNLSVFASVARGKQSRQLGAMADKRDIRSLWKSQRLLTSYSAAKHKRLCVSSDTAWTNKLHWIRMERWHLDSCR